MNDTMGKPYAWGVGADPGDLPDVIPTHVVIEACTEIRAYGRAEGAVEAFNALGTMSLWGLVRWWVAFRRRYGKAGAQ